MQKRAMILSALTLSAALSGAGCSRPDASPPKEPERSTTPAATPTVPASAVPAEHPAPGELAENLYDAARAGDWSTAGAKLDSLRGAVSPSPADSGVQSRLATLAQAIPARDEIRTMEASNALTRDFARASASGSRVPVEVVMLDYYGRELQIGASEGNAGLPRLQRTSDSIRSAWEAVRPRVERRGGATESRRFSALIQQVRAAGTPAEYGALAIPVLDEVDRLEAVFER